ncbi:MULTISPECIES: helix-turn-helix transcriptional regulator [Haloferacaceae]|uniref:Helix-turn-helix transcriptional regulator n=1 Tax=Halorubrum glutamatedens TaxID=2707018 RepID=A0ABD5QNM8_9EURY|nr:helix-turn-helix transcriptional regulator [Halobellus captivus]
MTDSENPGADARRKYGDEDFIACIKKLEPASTSEVAEAVGCTRRTADYRLKQLQDEDRVDSKMAGNSLIWYLTEE